MKKIKLTQGKYALVDDEDFESLNKYKWHISKSLTSDWYAVRNVPKTKDNKRTVTRMHRDIMNPGKELEVDHINKNTLDNRKINLRVCSRSENQRNRGFQKNNKSGFKGVCWNKACGKWCAQIKHNKSVIYIGVFNEKEQAALAYDQEAKKLFGNYAVLNFNS